MDILYDGLLSTINDLLQSSEDLNIIEVMNENTLLFMHDNAPCHKTEKMHEFLQENNILMMIWSANSPDLNPIEKL